MYLICPNNKNKFQAIRKYPIISSIIFNSKPILLISKMIPIINLSQFQFKLVLPHQANSINYNGNIFLLFFSFFDDFYASPDGVTSVK